MNCDAVERENIIERYLTGTLEPELKEQWEEHYFACEHCTEQLETWSAIEKPLRAMAPRIRSEIQFASPKPKLAPGPTRWLWPAAAIFTALLLGAAAWFGLPGGRRVKHEAAVSAPSPEWTELARFDPPAFSVPATRGIDTKAESRFLEAMKFYQARDYQHAIGGLQDALREDPEAAPSRFFLGACYLLTGRSAEAVSELGTVVAGKSVFAEEARFYLAKAYLIQGKTAEAVGALRPLADTQNEFSDEARRLIARLSPAR